ncbi:hypothetical protein Pmar_PMAR020839 [Perkinsus marinus ATCC 50983]|uniref:Uncharacterized protein n=2 Tax=Perkinsus marinus (strain ATCC 50983 / TXsc) TaxID=423536 RepID=C5KEA7_PERM5|nr:hypothetical protein Pmar_PMAR020839 [Perkinsus marinus ATCC 50983]EER17181.1 hypothetical protein Pmar_PMAR020839 [Perkinsus marinus ATCC 50983]|eukprot:XP_002785385.1 hypothetical protein Pmar_PMAR020839 [Perkinsus marinus ATCC 50983]
MSNNLVLKLRTRTQTMRVRVDSEKLTDMYQIKDYIEQSWTQLKGKDYRVYYVDEFGEMCLLNDLSLGDAIATVQELNMSAKNIPVLDLFIQAEGEEVPLSSKSQSDDDGEIAREVDVANTLAQVLDDMDYMDSLDVAEQFVEGLVAADSDLDAILDQLQADDAENSRKPVSSTTPAKKIGVSGKKSSKVAQQAPKAVDRETASIGKTKAKEVAPSGKKSSKIVQHTPKVAPRTTPSSSKVEVNGYQQVNGEAPRQFHVEKQVSSPEEASDMMVDLLTKMGFVDNKKAAEDLVGELLNSPDDLQRVADHIDDLIEGREPLATDSLDDTAKKLIDMLDDSGVVQDRVAAENLVNVLMDAGQDVDKVLSDFVDRTTTGKRQQVAVQQQ